jgi:hypothetical protein
VSDVDEWAADFTTPDEIAEVDQADVQAADEPGPQLVYPTLDRFVAELLAPTWARPVDGRRLTWCPSWWKHAEAIVRLEALWRSWEHLRLDPATGMSVWLRDHADHHMRILMDPEIGPFKSCHPERGHGERLKPLPLQLPPDGLFTPSRSTPWRGGSPAGTANFHCF